MKRQSCQRCKHPLAACLCKSLPPQPIDNLWPVHILQHSQERGHSLNTARIAGLGLARCHLHAVADTAVETTLPLDVISELNNAWLIYPGQESSNIAELDPAAIATRPLILLDASWRKSRRMLHTSVWLQTLPRISFATTPSHYRIRKQPAANYCSSLEAICTVLGTLEQNQKKYAPLLSSMDMMVDRQIDRMGEVIYRRNYRIEK
jgi:DTW domain-containing protein